MAESRFPELVSLLEDASAGLGGVAASRAHGFAAVAVGDRPYALVAHDGHIAVRLPDWDLFAAAFELPGSEPLFVDDERVGHWVVLPDAVRDDQAALREWLRHAHALTAGRV